MMMTERQLIERFLELQEHQGKMTDKQLETALNDPQMHELVEQTAFAKRAFRNEELPTDQPDMEEEWKRFAARHLDAKHETPQYSIFRKKDRGGISILFKIAATFISLIVVSGITLAAIHFIRLSSNPKPQIENTEQTVTGNPSSVLPTDTAKTDTTTAQNAIPEPVVFDNVRLDEMLTEIAEYYNAEVVFQNDAAGQLRFHFVWKHEDGIEHAIEKLNRFESLTVKYEQNKIIVE